MVTLSKHDVVNLYFLRHAIAVEPGEWQGPDEDRPLTKEGIARMRREARGIAGLSLELDAIVSSPLLRARTTAEIVAERVRLNDAVTLDARLGAGFTFECLREIVHDYKNASALMLVGHEPSFSIVVGSLIGGAAVEMKKAALAAVSVRDAASLDGTLSFLLPPKVLIALGKDRNRR
jgi:phosphohistidine phosphatase